MSITNTDSQNSPLLHEQFCEKNPKKIPETVEPITVQKSSKAVVVVHKKFQNSN